MSCNFYIYNVYIFRFVSHFANTIVMAKFHYSANDISKRSTHKRYPRAFEHSCELCMFNTILFIWLVRDKRSRGSIHKCVSLRMRVVRVGND